jgi:hypothetical protein
MEKEKEKNLDNINYKILEQNEERKYPIIIKKDTPNVHIIVKRDITVTPNQLKKYKNRTIFIDGAYKGAPFVNNEKFQYNLDHHEGVIRYFTLSSCEQAMIMVMKGLTLEEGQWDIYLNEPDFDAVLAVWILCNYNELLKDEDNILQKAIRLTRVEGIIDVHGFTMGSFTGYAPTTYESQKIIIEKLLEQEKNLKSSGKWNNIDFLKYTMLMLGKIDIVVYGQNKDRNKDFNITEHSKMKMLNSKYLIICESDAGIYAVEEFLKSKYQGKVGIIILRSNYDPTKYTLRLSNEFISPDLTPLYKALNKADKNVSPFDEANKWGGSEIIGGSPRVKGSGLSIDEIESISKKIFCKQSFWDKIKGKNSNNET